jgi:hypothetical protein
MRNRIKKSIAVVALIAVATTSVAACGGSGGGSGPEASSAQAGTNQGLPQGGESVKLDPAEFTTEITNPYFPLTPGSVWVYSGGDKHGVEEKIVLEVTNETKTIANGVEAVVVRDTVTANGVPVEVTDDWYAQDAEGNVWYMGEATQEYVNGKPGPRTGSFEAGVDGAQAGIAMPANPEPGLSYRQEYYKGEAEDKAAVVTVGQEQIQVPFGFYDKDVLMTRDLVPTEPKVQELKFYAPGVGPLLSLHTDGNLGHAELVSYTPGG